MRKKYPLNYGCVKYFIFSMLLFAVSNLLRAAEPTFCSHSHLCVDRFPEWLWSGLLFLAVGGLVLFVIKAYCDLVKQARLEKDDSAVTEKP